MGVSRSEGLALYDASDVKTHSYLFMPVQPPGTTGVARRLNPNAFYCAMRWDYHKTSIQYLRSIKVTVTNPKTMKSIEVDPVDWGPNKNTGRIIDLSPGAVQALGIDTDDVVMVEFLTP